MKTRDLKIVAGSGSGDQNGGTGEGEGEDVDMQDGGNENDQNLGLNLNVEGTVTSIAKCGSTLELHCPSEEEFSAVPFLKAVARVYDRGVWEDEYGGGGGVEGRDGDTMPGTTKTRTEVLDRVFSDVPVSRAQCERDWVKMCAFITCDKSSTTCWRPLAEIGLEVLKRVVEGSVLQGIDLGRQFLVSDLWKSVLDDDGLAPFPRGLFEAVLGRICELGEGVERGVAVYEMKCEYWFPTGPKRD